MERTHPIYLQGFVAYVGPSRIPVAADGEPDEPPEPFVIEDGPDYPLDFLLRNAAKREKKLRDQVPYLKRTNRKRCAEYVMVKDDTKRAYFVLDGRKVRRCSQTAGKGGICSLCQKKLSGIPLASDKEPSIIPLSNAAG